MKGKANASAVSRHAGVPLFAVRMVIKLDGSTALDALEGFRRAFSPLPPQVCHTLTYDQGK